MGLTSHFGVIQNLPTIGVAKSLLCGDVHGSYVYIQKNKVGVICGKQNPVYVSPGHRVSVHTAADIVEQCCQYRIPEPIRLAHRAATGAKKSFIGSQN